MRFLLYKFPTQPTINRVWSQSTMRTNSKTIDLSPSTTTRNKEEISKITKLWGQQCSSTCGCVVRFDVKADSRQQIKDISFSSKMVVSKNSPKKRKNNSKLSSLDPVMTTRHNQLLLKTCTCSTLNKLANRAVFAMKQKFPLSISRAQNMLESTGMRSSKAMRTVALHNLNCSPHDTHCYDVVEEALIACFKGYMPLPRWKRNAITEPTAFKDTITIGKKFDFPHHDEDRQFLNPLRFVQAAKRAGKVFPPNNSPSKLLSPSKMPAFHLQNEQFESDHVVYFQSTTLTQFRDEFAENVRGEHLCDDTFPRHHSHDGALLDWESYVDRRNHCETQ